MVYIGIDPGAKGSMCVIGNGKVLFKDFDLKDYSSTLKAFLDTDELMVAIEKVHAMPGQGVSSSFSFGQRLGELEGMLTALQIPYELVAPKDWQKACGIPAKSDKKGIASVIQKLYPTAELYGNKGGLRDGRSDALGLAHFIRLKYGR
ncbi:hypothetical protein [Campylobacter sp.]|uniref:hypothetical protein n=1 Tax=Campylobacter sp. TaxID=205 RepID=UPI002AA65DE4|nr:hypothetical protein [Campylobacter sp.]MCI7582758.1 hypothetical protein [Campylobacter sp.]